MFDSSFVASSDITWPIGMLPRLTSPDIRPLIQVAFFLPCLRSWTGSRYYNYSEILMNGNLVWSINDEPCELDHMIHDMFRTIRFDTSTCRFVFLR